eukprot:g12908.t1
MVTQTSAALRVANIRCSTSGTSVREGRDRPASSSPSRKRPSPATAILDPEIRKRGRATESLDEYKARMRALPKVPRFTESPVKLRLWRPPLGFDFHGLSRRGILGELRHGFHSRAFEDVPDEWLFGGGSDSSPDEWMLDSSGASSSSKASAAHDPSNRELATGSHALCAGASSVTSGAEDNDDEDLAFMAAFADCLVPEEDSPADPGKSFLLLNSTTLLLPETGDGDEDVSSRNRDRLVVYYAESAADWRLLAQNRFGIRDPASSRASTPVHYVWISKSFLRSYCFVPGSMAPEAQARPVGTKAPMPAENDLKSVGSKQRSLSAMVNAFEDEEDEEEEEVQNHVRDGDGTTPTSRTSGVSVQLSFAVVQGPLAARVQEQMVGLAERSEDDFDLAGRLHFRFFLVDVDLGERDVLDPEVFGCLREQLCVPVIHGARNLAEILDTERASYVDLSDFPTLADATSFFQALVSGAVGASAGTGNRERPDSTSKRTASGPSEFRLQQQVRQMVRGPVGAFLLRVLRGEASGGFRESSAFDGGGDAAAAFLADPDARTDLAPCGDKSHEDWQRIEEAVAEKLNAVSGLKTAFNLSATASADDSSVRTESDVWALRKNRVPPFKLNVIVAKYLRRRNELAQTPSESSIAFPSVRTRGLELVGAGAIADEVEVEDTSHFSGEVGGAQRKVLGEPLKRSVYNRVDVLCRIPAAIDERPATKEYIPLDFFFDEFFGVEYFRSFYNCSDGAKEGKHLDGEQGLFDVPLVPTNPKDAKESNRLPRLLQVPKTLCDGFSALNWVLTNHLLDSYRWNKFSDLFLR